MAPLYSARARPLGDLAAHHPSARFQKANVDRGCLPKTLHISNTMAEASIQTSSGRRPRLPREPWDSCLCLLYLLNPIFGRMASRECEVPARWRIAFTIRGPAIETPNIRSRSPAPASKAHARRRSLMTARPRIGHYEVGTLAPLNRSCPPVLEETEPSSHPRDARACSFLVSCFPAFLQCRFSHREYKTPTDLRGDLAFYRCWPRLLMLFNTKRTMTPSFASSSGMADLRSECRLHHPRPAFSCPVTPVLLAMQPLIDQQPRNTTRQFAIALATETNHC